LIPGQLDRWLRAVLLEQLDLLELMGLPAQPALLRSPRRRWGLGRFRVHDPMHLLMRSIVLRFAWSGKLHLDAETPPPGTEGREPERAKTAKWGAVVDPDDAWQAVLAKAPRHHRPHVGHLRSSHRLGQQQATTEEIADRQRPAPLPVTGPKMTFEIHRPKRVTAPGHRLRSSRQRWPTRTPAPDREHEAARLQEPCDRTCAGQARPRMLSL